MTDRDENDWMDEYYGSRAIEAEHAKEVAGLRDAIAQLEAENTRLTRERDELKASLESAHAAYERERQYHFHEVSRLKAERDRARVQRDDARRKCLERLSDAGKRAAAFELDWRGLYDRDEKQDDD
jgi:regulator of replication initiation timing